MSKAKAHFWSSKKIKRTVLVIIFVLINIAAIAATAISEFGNTSNVAELSTVKIRWALLIPATICFAVAITLEIFKYVMMIKELHRGHTKKTSVPSSHTPLYSDLKVASRTVLLGHYYDCVTPAAIGGQPFQIYHMRKHSDLTSGAATSVPLFGMISSQIGFLIIAVICFIFGNVDNENPALLIPAWIGLLFYAVWPVLVIGTSFFPKFTAFIFKFIAKILAKLKIVKDQAAAVNKIEQEVKSYSDSVKLILKTRGLFLKTVVLSIIFQLLIASIPFFVLTAFGGQINYFESLATTVAVTSAICFIPTPGNSGAAEGIFFIVFSALSEGYIFWAMLIWRFFSYYIYIIIGLLTYLWMHFERKYATIK